MGTCEDVRVYIPNEGQGLCESECHLGRSTQSNSAQIGNCSTAMMGVPRSRGRWEASDFSAASRTLRTLRESSGSDCNTVTFGPRGAHISGDEGPKMAMVGTPTDAARCVIPESLRIYSRAPAIQAASSPRCRRQPVAAAFSPSLARSANPLLKTPSMRSHRQTFWYENCGAKRILKFS